MRENRLPLELGEQEQPDAGNQNHRADGVPQFGNDLFKRGHGFLVKPQGSLKMSRLARTGTLG